MTTRFDLEQSILDCWSAVDTFKQAAEFPDTISDPDRAAEATKILLNGAAAIYQMKFERLFRQFEEMIESGKIKS